MIHIFVLITDNSLSEVPIFASTNPQYGDRLFIELQVQYMKIPSSNLGRTCCVQKLFLTFRTIFVHNMFSPCSAKRRASDKDLSVQGQVVVGFKRPETSRHVSSSKSLYSLERTQNRSSVSEGSDKNPLWAYVACLARCQQVHYGNTGCGVFKRGETKLERFLSKNQHT